MSAEQFRVPHSDLDSFRVDNLATLVLTEDQIDELRPPFIIDGFLRQGELLLLGAESKTRKSWLAQDAAFCVAADLPWLASNEGQRGFRCNRSKVFIFDLELNASEMRFRFAKARYRRFGGDRSRMAKVSRQIESFSLDGLNVSVISELLEQLKSRIKPGNLVVVDCFYRLVADGNETTEVAKMMEVLKRFVASTQCGVILVDHFRKAGDEKARNRFAGSFVKQAGPSTLVAIEADKQGILTLNVDARSFYGIPPVHVAFDPETYGFFRLSAEAMLQGLLERDRAELKQWITSLWKDLTDSEISARMAGSAWGITPNGAKKRFDKLLEPGYVDLITAPKGKPNKWILTESGIDLLESLV